MKKRLKLNSSTSSQQYKVSALFMQITLQKYIYRCMKIWLAGLLQFSCSRNQIKHHIVETYLKRRSIHDTTYLLPLQYSILAAKRFNLLFQNYTIFYHMLFQSLGMQFYYLLHHIIFQSWELVWYGIFSNFVCSQLTQLYIIWCINNFCVF